MQFFQYQICIKHAHGVCNSISVFIDMFDSPAFSRHFVSLNGKDIYQLVDGFPSFTDCPSSKIFSWVCLNQHNTARLLVMSDWVIRVGKREEGGRVYQKARES